LLVSICPNHSVRLKSVQELPSNAPQTPEVTLCPAVAFTEYGGECLKQIIIEERALLARKLDSNN